MKVWLLVDGEKSGPFESFDIRERISAGEISAEQLCWYQGAESWLPIGSVPQFEILFSEDKEDLTEPPALPDFIREQSELVRTELEEQLSKAPPLYAVRRLFARVHDAILYMTLVLVVFQERMLHALESQEIMPVIYLGLAYVVFDGLMTHFWKSSPGKFLLGLRTTDVVGHAIPLKMALLRSLRVWILGLGMWVVWPLALIISGFVAKRFGYFLWDLPKRYRAVARPFSGLHVAAYVLSLFAMSTLLNVALPQEMIEQMQKGTWAEEMMKDLK